MGNIHFPIQKPIFKNSEPSYSSCGSATLTAWLSVKKREFLGDLLVKQSVVSKKGRTKNDQIKINVLEFVIQGKGGVMGENIKIGASCPLIMNSSARTLSFQFEG